MEDKIKAVIKSKMTTFSSMPGNDELLSNLGIDSLGCLDLIAELEELFGIEIEDEVIFKPLKVQDIIDIVQKKC